jgi:hypothetical protein
VGNLGKLRKGSTYERGGWAAVAGPGAERSVVANRPHDATGANVGDVVATAIAVCDQTSAIAISHGGYS